VSRFFSTLKRALVWRSLGFPWRYLPGIFAMYLLFAGLGFVRDAWHRHSSQGHTVATSPVKPTHGGSSSVLPIVICLAVLAIVIVVLLDRSHRKHQARHAAGNATEQRLGDLVSSRRHASTAGLAWVGAALVVACAVTTVPTGTATVRAFVATALAAIGWWRGWSVAAAGRGGRPRWLLSLIAAQEDTSTILVLAAWIAAFIAASVAAMKALPLGGLGAAVILLGAGMWRRDVGHHWSTAEMDWWSAVTTEAGAERVAVVTATRPQGSAISADAGAAVLRRLRKLAAEFDDAGAPQLVHEYEDRFSEEISAETAALAVEERDARYGARASLTLDTIASGVDQLAIRLSERLGPEWAVTSDAIQRLIAIDPAEPERLPASVGLAELLPDHGVEVADPDICALLPVGRNVRTEAVCLDLAATPHVIAAGETGSGKTILLTDVAVAGLALGYKLLVAEIVKGGLDFLPLRPWASGWGCASLDAALALVEATYGEVVRRRRVLHEHGAVKWQELSPETRIAENVAPMLLLVDELSSMLIAGAVPKGLAKTHPLVKEAEARLAATSTLQLYLGKLAREARFVGISLLLGIQRPDAAILGGGSTTGGEFRANLGARIQLAPPGNMPSREAIGMLFSGEVTATALGELARLNDGRSKGLAVVHSEGGGVEGVRIAYLPPRDVPALLDHLGVRRHTGPLLGAPAVGSDRQAAADAPIIVSSDSPPPPVWLTDDDGEDDDSHASVGPASVPLVKYRPDGSIRRVVRVGADRTARGRYQLVLGLSVGEADHACDLVGLVVPGYDDVTDPIERCMARIRFARSVRLDAQVRAAGPFVMTTPLTIEERRSLAGVDEPPERWESPMPLVLVDADHRDEHHRPAGNVLWLQSRGDREFLQALAATGLVDGFREQCETHNPHRADVPSMEVADEQVATR
jgi:hypothetical protein